MSGPTPPWLRSLIIQYLGILNSLPHLGPGVQDFFPKRRNAPVHCDIHLRRANNQLRLQQTQRRCGEMADATDLKSVRASSSVWVRIPSSASFEATMGQVADCGLQHGEGSISDNIDMSAKMERPLVIPVILGTARQGR